MFNIYSQITLFFNFDYNYNLVSMSWLVSFQSIPVLKVQVLQRKP